MSVIAATAALSNVLATVATTTPTFRVFPVPPATLNSADLPAAILMHRGGTFTWHATQLRRTAYTFDILLIVDAVAQQRMHERIALAQVLYDKITFTLLNAPTLDATIDQLSTIVDNNGYSVVNWSGVDYFGYTITVSVVIKTITL